MPAQQRRRAGCTNTAGSGQLVRRVTAQRDEIRDLPGIHPIPRADLGRTDARHLARAHGIEDRGAAGGKLKSVTITARDQGRSAAPLLRSRRGGQEIIRFVTRGLRIRKAACGHEFRQDRELLEQGVVE